MGLGLSECTGVSWPIWAREIHTIWHPPKNVTISKEEAAVKRRMG